ncbi:MAG: cyclopropane fatty acyl phospholipid synthase [Chlamydiales bacterium]|nr:cyclopropane fatty acyl phospholipid synthase [Chlamydiia bacterium]MCP5507392.1 cyclopropane fatty acyl phospholipid synthase [Chlamydiales bacterium]
MYINKAKARSFIESLIKHADITINGNRGWDITVNDERFFTKVLNEQELGFGESYMDGWWDCPHIDQMIDRLMRARIHEKIDPNISFYLQCLLHKLVNFQTIQRSKQVAYQHYDLGNPLYEKMLDSRMNYSCGYWKHADNLDKAQEDKLELLCRKLHLKPGMTLLDIGCGWGAMAYHAAKYHGAKVLGVTISKEQKIIADERCRGLPVTIKLEDYRHVTGTFDRIVSIGMFEHVGQKNYATYMNQVRRNLSDDGIFVLHTIGSNERTLRGNRWITKYIFPNSALPSPMQIAKSFERRFVMEDWHNFGADYDFTLMAWHHNFIENWDTLKHQYDERFFRMWNYYLLSCAGGFRARELQLWQIVLTKYGIPGGYQYEPLTTEEALAVNTHTC